MPGEEHRPLRPRGCRVELPEHRPARGVSGGVDDLLGLGEAADAGVERRQGCSGA